MRRIALDGELTALCPGGELEEKLIWAAIQSRAPEFVLRWLGDETVVPPVRNLGLVHAPGPFDQGWHDAYVTLRVPFRVPTFHLPPPRRRADFLEELTLEPTLPIHFRLVLRERDGELLVETRIRPGRFSPEEETELASERFELTLSYPELEGTPPDVASAEILRDHVLRELRQRRRSAWQPRIYETVTRCLTEWHFNTNASWWIERESLDLEVLVSGAVGGNAGDGEPDEAPVTMMAVATSLAAEFTWREFPASEANKAHYMELLGELLQTTIDDKDLELRVLVEAILNLDEEGDTYFEARRLARLTVEELLTEAQHERMHEEFLERFYAARSPRQGALLALRAHYMRGEKPDLET